MAKPPIQALPNGLLGLLGIQNGGQFPSSLGGELVPVFDLSNLYYTHEGRTETASATQNVAAVGYIAFATLTPGQGEYLAIRGVSIRTDTLSAGEAITYNGPLWRYAPNNQVVGGNQEVVVAATQSGIVGTTYDTPLILPPSWELGIYVKSFTIGADLTAAIWFARLPT